MSVTTFLLVLLPELIKFLALVNIERCTAPCKASLGPAISVVNVMADQNSSHPSWY